MNKYLLRAEEIATMAHADQTDLADKPYIDHPRRVVELVQGDNKRIVAWLHDVIEDHPDFLPVITAEFPDHIIEALDALTHRSDEPYDQYIQRVSSNALATAVKIADLIDNTDLSRLSWISYKDMVRQVKYHKALRFLLQEYL